MKHFLFSVVGLFVMVSMPIHARTIVVKDSARAVSPSVWSESFDSVSPATPSYYQKDYVHAGHSFHFEAGCVATTGGMFGAGNPCAISKITGTQKSVTFTTEKIQGIKTLRFKIKVSAALSSYADLQIQCSNDKQIWAGVDVKNATISGQSTGSPVALEWNTWYLSIPSSSSLPTVTYTVTFNNVADRYIRWKYSGSTNKMMYIDDIEVEYYPWVYSSHEEQVWDYERSLSANMGTICLPNAVAEGDLHGAICYRVLCQDKVASNITLEQVSAMEAGKPYIFVPESGATSLRADYTGDAVAMAGSENGLHGSFNAMSVSNGCYILSQNQLYKAADGCSISANKAYLVLSEVPEADAAMIPQRGNRMVVQQAQSGETTYIYLFEGDYTNAPRKIWRDGQIIIQRGKQQFNLLGQQR